MVSRVEEMHRNREIAYTVPTQPKSGLLGQIESEISEISLTHAE
jgi:hypothetical protein